MAQATLRSVFQKYQRSGLRGVARAVADRLFNKPVVDIADEYIGWLTFANAGMLNRGNLYCFEYAIRNLPSSAPIVEIGSFCGLSTNALTYYKTKHGVGNRLITCDKWIFEGAEQGGPLVDGVSVSHAQYRAFVKDSYIRNIQLFSNTDLPYTIEAFSDEFFAAWAQAEERRDVLGRPIVLGGPISLAYIDGNHTYDYAKRDFEHCDSFLVPGGFLLFDDSADDNPWQDVRQVAQLVERSGRYDLIAKNPNYFFKKR